jgi:hypothetical protein
MIPTSIIALFCEDIREEKSGELTLVGILPDNASVPPLPEGLPTGAVGGMPKLCIYIRMNFDPRNDLEHISTKVIFPDGTERNVNAMDDGIVAKAKAEAVEQGNPLASVISRIEMAPFPIPTIGRMRLEMTIGSQTYLCGALNFTRIQENPTSITR